MFKSGRLNKFIGCYSNVVYLGENCSKEAIFYTNLYAYLLANFGSNCSMTTLWEIFAMFSLNMCRNVICTLPFKILTPPLNSETAISYKTGLFTVIVGHLPVTLSLSQ